MVAANISSLFKRHQTGGALFQALQVAKRAGAPSQSRRADGPKMESSKLFAIFFYSVFKSLKSFH